MLKNVKCALANSMCHCRLHSNHRASVNANVATSVFIQNIRNCLLPPDFYLDYTTAISTGDRSGSLVVLNHTLQ